MTRRYRICILLLMQEMIKAATLEFEHRIEDVPKYGEEVTKILDFLEHFTLRIAINAPSPVVVDKDAHIVEIDLFAFLPYRTRFDSSNKKLSKQQEKRSMVINQSDQIMNNTLLPALRSVTAGIVIDNILRDPKHKIPRDMLIDTVLILLDSKFLNELPSY